VPENIFILAPGYRVRIALRTGSGDPYVLHSLATECGSCLQSTVSKALYLDQETD
jgi:hypothetical protein